MGDVLAAFAVVFLAELGDKSQLVALTLAGRHPAVRVLAVLTVTIAVLQALSVTLGALLDRALPHTALAVGTGLVFLAFAVWTWRASDDAGREDDDRRSTGLLGVAGAYFVAELGDKTMLTTAGLAADRGALPVWVGSFAALVTTTAIAVLAGHGLANRLSPRLIHRLGAVAFAVVGLVTLLGAA